MSDMKKMVMKINLILLGLVMLIPGLLKLFVMKPTAIVGMLGELGFPTASFLAWVLILSEIIFGALILAKYKLNYTVWPPIIILVVASFTAHWGNWPNVLVHLALASNFWVWGTKKA